MKRRLKIFYIVLLIFTLYILFEFLIKIFLGSLSVFDVIIAGLLIANLCYSFYLTSLVSEHLGWHKGQTVTRK